MSERLTGKNKAMKVGLLGASFDTGNLGVSALAESSIKVILNRWPDAEIILLGSGYEPGQHQLSIMGRDISVKTLPIRFSKNIFLPYHFLWFTLYSSLAKVLPKSRLKEALVNHNQYFRLLFGADLVVDITGGDSFSDMYGFPRFFLGFLCKWLVIFLGKKLLLLPQTYGPYRSSITKLMARYVLNHADLIYSRDQTGIEYVADMLSKHAQDGKVRFAPDVAFVLDSRKPEQLSIEPSASIRTRGSVVVGINISGLLFNGGYTRDNMFKLKNDYRKLIYAIIEMLLEDQRIAVLLVPHVFPPQGLQVESDFDACQQVYKRLNQKYPGRVLPVQSRYDQGEIKYIIGLCNFFVGSRLHACIAALSQCIPAVGLAYSDKFVGVFDSVGIGNLAIDLRTATEPEVLARVEEAVVNGCEMAGELSVRVAEAQREVLNILQEAL